MLGSGRSSVRILREACPPRERLLRLKELSERLQPPGEPFLRTLLALARTMEECGKSKDAVPVYEKALSVAPDDPLEIRHHLARCLLNLRRLQELKQLLDRYPAHGALAAWIHVLELHKSDKQTGLERALQEARQANPHVEDFLTSRRLIPKHRDTGEEGAPGSVEEALRILERIGEAWFSDRTALYWLLKTT